MSPRFGLCTIVTLAAIACGAPSREVDPPRAPAESDNAEPPSPPLVLAQSVLIDSLSANLAHQPDRSIADAAALGNELIGRLGFPFDLQVQPGVVGDTTVDLLSSEGPVRATLPHEGPCDGFQLYEVPVARAVPGAPVVLASNQAVTLDTTSALLLRARLFDSTTGRELPSVAVPQERYGNPYAAVDGGRSLLWKVTLRRGTLEWWKVVRGQVPDSTRGDEPYLVLEIDRDGTLRFLPTLDSSSDPPRGRTEGVREAFTRSVGDFFDRFDGAAFFSGGVLVVYNHPCT